ncbi:ATP-binding cassette domain-containing protein [Algoriphagus sp. AK58]|uniref:ABC transporter ATP-binding protein n=1 Tax=Algoriphagus sp. AK58 TaxID=1406877 RepID=UPI00164FA224|nr:ATP-binding cassette domain-containing protein [Algoriphagus sp. AK58]MBC6368971.1 ABC transporter ATP-binding protein [Algoriphagus sp. AK58]
MLKIQVQKAAKRFQYEWIFKNLNLELTLGDSLAITGGNGSGKSTLLKCISGAVPLSGGSISYVLDNRPLPDSQWYTSLAIASPYLELPEEFTLTEAIEFHFKFKRPLAKMSPKEIMEILYLENHHNKPISQFSSGMKQRLKLGLAVFSEVPVILLDEPTSNLDKKGIGWYVDLMENYTRNRISIVCSNEPREYEFCLQKIAMEDFK